MSLRKKWSVGVKGGVGISLDLKSSGSGSVELAQSGSVLGHDSGVGLKSGHLCGVLSLVISKSLLPTLHVTWERGAVGGSRPGDFVSEFCDEAHDLLNSSTIAGLSEHGEGVDERKVGGVLS